MNGVELWKSDGTAAGTVIVANIRSGSAASAPASLTAIGSTVYFSADDGTTGRELWRSGGTAATTAPRGRHRCRRHQVEPHGADERQRAALLRRH